MKYAVILIILSTISHMSSALGCSELEFIEKSICEKKKFTSPESFVEYLKKSFTHETFYRLVRNGQGSAGDLNNDGIDELVVTGGGCNHNCESILLTKEPEGYRVIGYFIGGYIDSLPFPKVLGIPKEKSLIYNGFKHISIFNHSGMGEGSYSYYSYNGSKYFLVANLDFNTRGFWQ